VRGSLQWRHDRGRRPAAEVGSGGGGPVVGGGEAVVRELPGGVSVIAIFWTGQKWAEEQDGPRR
jgi:hypothetical protein